MSITQDNLDQYVADTANFWNTFHNMLKAPYAFWRENKSTSLQEWVDMCWNTDSIVLGITNLSEYPVLKGEGLVISVGTGMVVTNYRIICSEGGSLINIPFHNLLHYDVQTDASDRGNDLVIKYLREGKEEILRIDEWIKDEIVRAVKNAGEFEKLSEIEKKILETSHYDLNKSGLNAQTIEMLPKTPEKGCFGK
jgi:hypothetical protein